MQAYVCRSRKPSADEEARTARTGRTRSAAVSVREADFVVLVGDAGRDGEEVPQDCELATTFTISTISCASQYR